ncbi:hypothetical protein [Acinetobacter sp. ANC 3813]|uniref:hypothetical protein n=1 Tax=Acinetobacter sp. ANC 3813 TaxID=1977873 RepID=UPI000A32ED3A|nr:hypothetical protein [Acinetobacter sp. ANC 3813]OTG88923.1 hypothetical protein B9T34_14290 [Acinetobacter sp. ANC 3813]
MNLAKRTYMNLMIFKTISENKGRISVQQIHQQIEPNMGMSVRSLQRYLKGLTEWGLLVADGQSPQGFKLSEHAKNIFEELAGSAAH